MKLTKRIFIAATLLLFISATQASAETPILKLQPSDNINEMVANAKGVVLVDFYADWCGPCREQGEILDKVQAVACKNRASIIKVDVDKYKALAKRFRVTSLPTMLLVKNGKIIERQIGVADHETVSAFLQR